MLKKIMQGLMALTLALGVTFASAHDAEARRGHRGALLGLGILGGLALGAAAAHSRGYRYYDGGPRCYYGPRECGWSDRHCFRNSWGDRVCRGGHYSCYRPRYCD